MLKKLQTYNRQILAAVSVLLLIVFLAPTAVTQCSRGGGSSDTAWARTTDGTTLTLGDLQDMRAQLAVLEVMGSPVVGRLGASKSPEHWWLLVKEARDAGMVGGIADGRATLDAIAARQGVSGDQLLGGLQRGEPLPHLREFAHRPRHPGDERIDRRLVLLVGEEQLLGELLAGTQAAELDLHLVLRHAHDIRET